MNIALIGYGKVGKEIHNIVNEKKYNVNKIFNSKHLLTEKENLDDIDICIEFTTPNCVYENLKKLISLKKNIVCGTTGWNDKLNEIRNLVEKNNVGFVYSSNFSIGVQIFFDIIKNASQLLNKIENYDVFVNEIHHNQKKDFPSGTAISLGETILQNFKTKKEILTSLNDKILPNQLQVSSIRSGNFFGTHSVTFDSDFDTIELKHIAKSRRGFALGAIFASEWIQNKKGFYSFNEILKNYFYDI